MVQLDYSCYEDFSCEPVLESRIQSAFSKGKVFIGYLTAGDGGVDKSVSSFLTLVEGGVDILEIGMPCENPFADGPTIRNANERALLSGTTPDTVLEIARKIRRATDAPLVLLSYYQPLLQAGNSYLEKAKQAGFDAILVPDLSIENEHAYLARVRHAGLDPILLVTPTTTEERINETVKQASGFIYYASQSGTTGVRKEMAPDFDAKIQSLRQKTYLPIVVGFGIGNRHNAQIAIKHSDGFVVGSALVSMVAENRDSATLLEFVKSLDPR